MTKKIVLIIGILAALAVAALLILGSGPTEEGESRVGFSIRNYLPFGKSSDADPSESGFQVDESGDGEPVFEANQPVPRLRKISNEPTGGAVIFESGTTSIVRFVEKGTGNVFETNSKTTLVERLTNTTIPKIVRGFWLPDGSGFLAQTLIPETEIIETGFVKLSKNIAVGAENLTPYSTTISDLPTGIKEIAIKPDGSKIFYYTVGGQNSNWYVSDPDGTNDSLVFSHPLTEWRPFWVAPNTIEIRTKPSYAAASYLYFFNLQSKNLEKAVENLNIFPTQPNNDKCVWQKETRTIAFCAVSETLPASNYPDAWYRGQVNTEDIIERVDLNNDIHYRVADLSELSGQKIDVVDPALSPDDSHLIFRNKIDGYLWMLRIEE